MPRARIDDPVPSVGTVSAELLDPIPSVLTAGSMNIFAGSSGAGKSSMLCKMLRWMLEGQSIFGHQTNIPPAVSWISMDRPWRETQALFDLYGVPSFGDTGVPIHGWSRIDHPNFVSVEDLWKASAVPGRLAQVFARIVDQFALPPGSLVIVDPGPTLIGADQNHYVRMALGMMALYDVVNHPDRQYCLIATDHPAKQLADRSGGYRRIEDRIGGSAGKGAHANTLMYIAEPYELGDKEHDYTFYWKPRRAKSEKFSLRRDDTTGLLERAEAEHRTAVVLPELKEEPELQAVLDAIPYFPQSITWPALLQMFGDRGKRTVERQVKILVDRKYVSKLGRGVFTRTVDAAQLS